MSTTDPWRNPRPDANLDEVPHHVPRKDMVLVWLRVWWPALLWAVVVFVASSDAFSSEHTRRFIDPVLRWLFPSASQDSIFYMHHLVRKAAHFVEYFVFFVFIYRGIRRSRPGWHWSWAFAAWFIAALYSALDEFHQIFVASRGPSAWDSLLDPPVPSLLFSPCFFSTADTSVPVLPDASSPPHTPTSRGQNSLLRFHVAQTRFEFLPAAAL